LELEKTVIYIAFLLTLILFVSGSAYADMAQSYPPVSNNVVWTSPSKDAAGSMPLGNGEVGMNLWADNGGNINFYISRSDSLSEISRLLKVGQVKISLSPNPFADGEPFTQTLSLRNGQCQIDAGSGDKIISLRIFVDAVQPVIHCVGHSATPYSVTVNVVSWRTQPHTISGGDEMSSAWTMSGAPFPLVESADLFPNVGAHAVAWYHRNENSIAFQSTMQLQSLTSLLGVVHDPLLHRTFGGFVTADGFDATDAQTLTSDHPVNEFDIAVAAPALQCDLATEWIDSARTATFASNAAEAENRTSRWWNSYWDRSWVITGPPPPKHVPGDSFPLRIGYDSNGGNKFPGRLGRTAVYDRPLDPAEILHLAQTPQNQPSTLVNGLLWSGIGQSTELATSKLNFDRGFTLEAWIKPDGTNVGRIFDKLTAGQDDGLLLDIYPGNSLRFIFGTAHIDIPAGAIVANTWQHVAATLNASTGQVDVYLDGKVVGQLPSAGRRLSVGEAYTLQRYVQACGGRGTYPIKFNGGIFTVEPTAMGLTQNPDFRRWGDSHWYQNVRHMYHPMLASGDYEMMDPFFHMYEAARPLAEGRTKLYFNAEGSFFPETMTNFGWNRTGQEPQTCESPWWRYAWNQGPELVALMLDRWDYTADTSFLKNQTLPMAVSVLRYFDTRFKKDGNGRIILDPDQVIETYRDGVTNDMPTTAGLNAITARLCALPANLVSSNLHQFFEHMKASAPIVPLKEVVEDGKTVEELSPAQTYQPKASNSENPELYAVWPFRLYAVGLPNIQYARTAYRNRINHLDIGWGYDGNCAALLGLTDEAARIMLIKCANSNPAYRWPATWGPNYDWLPDQNHGGNLLETTQLMLLQCEGSRIYLLPAWPKSWDVTFKLRATNDTVVQCIYANGKIQSLQVTPRSRTKDVITPNFSEQ
jgi:hypothetical protein